MDIRLYKAMKKAIKKDFEELYKAEFPDRYEKSIHKRHMEIDLADFENLYMFIHEVLEKKRKTLLRRVFFV